MQIYGYNRGTKLVEASSTLVLVALFCGVSQGPNTIAQEGTSPAQVQTSPKNDELEQLRKSVRQLNAEVARLKVENAKLEKYREVDYLRDRLVKEEQRLEALQKELVEIGARESSLQKRLDEIEPQLRPDQIEQSRAGVGSMRPEEDREAIVRQLSNEKRRIQTQLDQLASNRLRIPGAISSAEASIVTLRQRLKDAVRAAGLTNTGR
jgi:chromosome segregation ATPase